MYTHGFFAADSDTIVLSLWDHCASSMWMYDVGYCRKLFGVREGVPCAEKAEVRSEKGNFWKLYSITYSMACYPKINKTIFSLFTPALFSARDTLSHPKKGHWSNPHPTFVCSTQNDVTMVLFSLSLCRRKIYVYYCMVSKIKLTIWIPCVPGSEMVTVLGVIH